MENKNKWWRVPIDDYFKRKIGQRTFSTYTEQRSMHRECVEWFQEGIKTFAAQQERNSIMHYFFTNLYKHLLGVKEDD